MRHSPPRPSARTPSTAEQAARGVDADALDEVARRLAGFRGEGAAERALAHAGARRQHFYAEVGGEVLERPFLGLAHGRAGGELRQQMVAELRLAGRPLE